MKRLSRLALVLTAGWLATAPAQAGNLAAKATTGEPTVPHADGVEIGGVQVGVGVICDSSEQVERYLTAKKVTSVELAIDVVNRDANDQQACGMAMIAFMPGDRTGDVNMTDGTMHVTRITIVAVATDNGWFRIPNTVQYTAFFEKLESI